MVDVRDLAKLRNWMGQADYLSSTAHLLNKEEIVEYVATFL